MAITVDALALENPCRNIEAITDIIQAANEGIDKGYVLDSTTLGQLMNMIRSNLIAIESALNLYTGG